MYELEFEVFLNLRVVTPLFPSSFQAKNVSEGINHDLGKHVEDFNILFQRMEMILTKSKRTSVIPKSTEALLNNFEKKQNSFITIDQANKAIKQLKFELITNFKLLKHQKQGLIWMLQRENFYKHNKNDSSLDFGSMATQNLKQFLNPLWDEYILKKDLRCNQRIQPMLEQKILNCNEKNKNQENKMLLYYHKMTGQMVLEFPDVGCHIDFLGGLLADEMGLGKTILILSLIGISKIFNETHQFQLLEKHQIKQTGLKCKIFEKFEDALEKIEKYIGVEKILSLIHI